MVNNLLIKKLIINNEELIIIMTIGFYTQLSIICKSTYELAVKTNMKSQITP